MPHHTRGLAIELTGMTSTIEMDEPLSNRLALSVQEAAKVVGISRRQIYEEMSRGRLRSIKVGKRRLVPHDDLKHWLRTRPPA
jgi:excisionase family DNA binding protein